MTQPMPSPARRQYLIQNGMKPLHRNSQAGKLREVLDELFGLVLTPAYLLHDDADNPPEHQTTGLGYMMEIATGESFDWATVRQAAAIALLHDIWPVRRITRAMIRKAPDHEKPKLVAQREKSVPIHMQRGCAQARGILNRLNKLRCKVEYDTAAIERICGVIAIHDNPKIGKPIPTADTLAVAFREADRLWMLNPHGVRTDLARKGNNHPTHQDRVAQAQDNVKSFHEERAEVYASFPPTDFIAATSLFRTKTGHGIFERLQTFWGL